VPGGALLWCWCGGLEVAAAAAHSPGLWQYGVQLCSGGTFAIRLLWVSPQLAVVRSAPTYWCSTSKAGHLHADSPSGAACGTLLGTCLGSRLHCCCVHHVPLPAASRS
jgi:hypothetical protein